LKWSLYRELSFNAFRANMAYKTEVGMFLFGQIINIFVQVYIWYAIYGSHQQLQSNIGSVYISEMITYVVISNCIAVFATSDVIYKISNKVSSGEIVMDLIKPMSFRSTVFCQSLGANLFRILFELIPVILVSLLFFHLLLPQWTHLLFFLLMLVNSLILNFLVTYIIGLISFWYILVWQLNTVLNGLVRLFSGAFIPVWFFPDSFVTISYFFPFRLMYYEPVSVYLGKVSGGYAISLIILQQFLWIIGLLLLERLMWSRAVNKLVLQGG
jgi:ABC-2 type transport system permease protein